MSDTTTWAVLTDGRYIRVLINKPPATSLNTLKADDSEALAQLSYHVVTGIKHGATNGTASREKNNMQLLAEFLQDQLQQDMYQKLIVAAPEAQMDNVINELNDDVKAVMLGQLEQDLLAHSIDDIEKELHGLLTQA